MEKVVAAWSSKILPTFDLIFSGRRSQSTPSNDLLSYANHPNGITVEAILAWYQGTKATDQTFAPFE